MTAPETVLAAASASPSILVVEDEVLIRAMVAEALRDEGFHVIEAANADEAREYLLAGDGVDLVFTDIDMPGSMNGIDLARYVLDQYPGIKVILTSGGVNGRDARIAGPFLPKPFRLGDAVDMMRAALASALARKGQDDSANDPAT